MKFMNTKRFGATVMAGALTLSLAAPAFAASTTITGAFDAVDLSVTVSQTGNALINPYGLPVNLTHTQPATGGGTETITDGTISGEQITTGAPLTIANGSAVALAVSATVTGTEAGNAKLVSDLTDGVTTENDGSITTPNNIVAQFEAFPAPGIDGSVVAAAAVTNPSGDAVGEKADAQAALNEGFAALKSEDAVLTAPLLTTASEAVGTLVLREGDDEGVAQDGGVAFFRLAGEVVKNPTTAWSEGDSTATPVVPADGFTATIAFTFEPAEYIGTVTVAGAESVAVGATAKLTVSGLPQGVTAKYDTIKWTSSKETYVTVVDGTKKPTTGNNVEATALTATVTGVKTSSTKSLITVEFVGSDDITYRGTLEVKCG